jgi:hypothetical protein
MHDSSCAVDISSILAKSSFFDFGKALSGFNSRFRYSCAFRKVSTSGTFDESGIREAKEARPCLGRVYFRLGRLSGPVSLTLIFWLLKVLTGTFPKPDGGAAKSWLALEMPNN